MSNEKVWDRYIKDVCNGIDAVRADLWETAITPPREPEDNHSTIAGRQSARAEVWGAVLDYREERIGFSELLMSLQAFDPRVTPEDVMKLVRGDYDGFIR